jgi:dienelactone hydrolase
MDDVLNCIYYHAGKMFNIDTESIYWLGFSEGGTFSSLAGMKFSKELKAVVPYAGSAPHFQNVERKIPSYFVVGTNDRFLDTVQSDAKEWISSNHPVNEFYATGVNHSFSGLHGALTAQQVWQWISTVAADPVKSGFVRLKSSNE